MALSWSRVLTIFCLLLGLALGAAGQKKPHFIGSRTTMVHLFEWTWPDIANECEQFLGPNGYGGVQISPPNENRVVAPLRPWWERYQPLSYMLTSRSGDEAQLREMITRCSRVGVRVYVDAVINHMTGQEAGTSRGTAGSSAVYANERYPAVPYGPGDFHAPCAIEDYNDPVQVRNCQLSSLLDLDQGQPHVRDAIAAYMNRLVDMGVAGFRVDAAKHMWPQDLDAIYAKLKDLNPEFGFVKGARPYIYQEVIDLGAETIRKTDYNSLGDVTEFQFSAEIGRAFRGETELRWMRNWGHDWGFLEPLDAIVFVDNHDNQRGHGAGGPSILTYKDGTRYRLAVAFMLAHPYGQVTRVMSSYAFNDTDQGPPATPSGQTTSPRLLASGLCDTAASGWVCEHRWPTIAHMVEFRNQVAGTTLANWWDDGHNQIAFARGRLGFVAFNNNPDAELRVKLQTGLPAGTYCDVIEGRKPGAYGCPANRKFVVAGDGQLELLLPKGPSGMAIHVGTKLPEAPKRGGFGKQGFQCEDCRFNIHQKCSQNVVFKCPGQETDIDADCSKVKHQWESTTYTTPTFCDDCGMLLHGIVHQGVHCDNCKLNVHHNCKDKVPPLCGADISELRGKLLLYVELKGNVLKIDIKEASNLIPMDTNGLSDPYIAVQLHPDRSGKTKKKTKTIQKNLSPVFNESFTYEIKPEDRDKRLLIEVWDWDRTSRNDFMGSFSFTLDEIQKEPIDGWYKFLSQVEGEHYNIPCSDPINDIARLRDEVRRDTQPKRRMDNKDMPHNMSKRDMIRAADFNFMRVLGKGSFGKVLLAERRGTDELYAVKVLRKDVIIQTDDMELPMTEKRVLALSGKPPFLVSLHSCFQTMDRLFFVMEYCKGGDLLFHMQQYGRFKESVAIFYAVEVALALFFLHNQQIIYRDLKLDNILLDVEGHVKIADFGLSKEGTERGDSTRTFCGTCYYMAPEILSYEAYNYTVDWWSYGVLLYELMAGQAPFEGDDDEAIFRNIKEKKAVFPKHFSQDAMDIITSFLAKKPNNRLGAGNYGEQEIKSHPFYKDIDWEKAAECELEPPIVPKIKYRKDIQNFDKAFTTEKTDLTPTDKLFIMNLDQNDFIGFSYMNPEFITMI